MTRCKQQVHKRMPHLCKRCTCKRDLKQIKSMWLCSECYRVAKLWPEWL